VFSAFATLTVKRHGKKSKHIMNIDLSDEETNLRASITAFASALKMNSYVDDKPVYQDLIVFIPYTDLKQCIIRDFFFKL
jgi:hypothetical protein